MLKVGLTGGIGSGKSTVAKIFELLDVPVYYADDRAKQLMTENQILVENISSLLGDNAYTKDFQLNRPYIADKVFSDEGLLGQLNALVHPAVGKDFEDWCQALGDVPYCIKEAALLYEAGSYSELDKIVVVAAPEKVRISRVVERDNVTAEQVVERIKNQWEQSEKIRLADFIINNDGSRFLTEQVLQIDRILKFLNKNLKLSAKKV